jgi:hypothetical protein
VWLTYCEPALKVLVYEVLKLVVARTELPSIEAETVLCLPAGGKA